jgi:Trk-type K+ transport system membrane component
MSLFRTYSSVLMCSARRQLAFDIWWLAFALWLVCIIEVRLLDSGICSGRVADDQKSKIDREDTATWFNVFNIIFELVSAYGTVGLSLGSPIANYSLVPPFIPDLLLMIDLWELGVHCPNLSFVPS